MLEIFLQCWLYFIYTVLMYIKLLIFSSCLYFLKHFLVIFQSQLVIVYYPIGDLKCINLIHFWVLKNQYYCFVTFTLTNEQCCLLSLLLLLLLLNNTTWINSFQFAFKFCGMFMANRFDIGFQSWNLSLIGKQKIDMLPFCLSYSVCVCVCV